MLTRNTITIDSELLEPVQDSFLDTCKRMKLESHSEILTYLDVFIKNSQDQLGMCYEIPSELELSSYTKYVSVQSRVVHTTVSTQHISWKQQEIKNSLEKDTEILQKKLFKMYKELGEKHRLTTNWIPRNVRTSEELSQVFNLSSLYIAKNGRLGGGDFVIVGNRAYELLLSNTNFVPTDTSLNRRISIVGQMGINFSVFLNLDEDETFIMGKSMKANSNATGVYLAECKKDIVEMNSLTAASFQSKLVARDNLGEYGFHPEYNFFTPTLIW